MHALKRQINMVLAVGFITLMTQNTVSFAQGVPVMVPDEIPPYPENVPLSPGRQGAIWAGHENTPNGGRPEINTVAEMLEVSGYTAPAAIEYARLAALAADGNWGPSLFYYCKNPHGGTALNAEYPVPLEVFDGVYSIGHDANNIWAIETSDGIILVDTLNNAEQAYGFIVGNMMRLGLDPLDIKMIIVSHGHGDHSGGVEYLNELTGAAVGMSEVAYQIALASGSIPPRDENDFAITDGMEIVLGDTTLTALLTPGHTPGTISLMIPVTWNGEEHMASYMGGAATPRDIETIDQWRRSMEHIQFYNQALHADVILGNHTISDDGLTRIAQMAEDPSTNPYIVGHEAVLGYFEAWHMCLGADIEQKLYDGQTAESIPSRAR